MTAYEYNQLQNMLTDIQNRKPEYLSCKYQEGYETAILKMKSMVHSFYNSHKTADEPVRHGHWIKVFPRRMGRNATYKCSVCKKLRSSYYNDVAEWDHCPCGAKMDGKENEK